MKNSEEASPEGAAREGDSRKVVAERAVLQFEAARQAVQLAKDDLKRAKDDLKRARKRFKEAKREAKRARKHADSLQKKWKRRGKDKDKDVAPVTEKVQAVERSRVRKPRPAAKRKGVRVAARRARRTNGR